MVNLSQYFKSVGHPPTVNPSLSYQVVIHLTLYPHLLLICPPLLSTPWCEAVISSFLFNPLLLVCAFPPFVSMAMPSALHQEPRLACSLISLSPLSVSLLARIVLSMSLLNQPPLLFLSLPSNPISSHPFFHLLKLFVSLLSFFCYPCSPPFPIHTRWHALIPLFAFVHSQITLFSYSSGHSPSLSHNFCLFSQSIPSKLFSVFPPLPLLN